MFALVAVSRLKMQFDVRNGFGKFSSSTVILRSAPKGTGIISGGPSRAIFEALGISDVVSKAIGTKNPHNIVRSTIKALRMINTPKSVSARRSIEINSVISKREN